ncbi:MAG: spermidine synthase, partial [Chthoniobacter sp.]
VVEINPAVVPVAQQYFDFEPSKVTLHFGDGREYINRAPKQYDAVVLDAFLGDSSPSHLMSREAFTGIGKMLKPGGVLVINSFGDFAKGRDFFVASLHKTLKASFGAVRIHYNPVFGNVFFVATNDKELVQHHEPDLRGVPGYLQEGIKGAFDGLMDTDPRSGIVLTDDYNPADAYDAENRENIRRNLAFRMR